MTDTNQEPEMQELEEMVTGIEEMVEEDLQKYPFPKKGAWTSWDQTAYIIVGPKGFQAFPKGQPYPTPQGKYPAKGVVDEEQHKLIVAEKDKKLLEHENTIKELNLKIEELDNKIKEFETQVKTKDEEIAKLSQGVQKSQHSVDLSKPVQELSFAEAIILKHKGKVS